MVEDKVIEFNVYGKIVFWVWGWYINNVCINLFFVFVKWMKNIF